MTLTLGNPSKNQHMNRCPVVNVGNILVMALIINGIVQSAGLEDAHKV